MTKKHENHLIEDHYKKNKEKHEEKHEEKYEEKHDEKHDEKTWRSFDFDRKSWRENIIESHEEKSCRLFNQAIYIYLISCWVESSFRVELSSQASQLNLSAWIQLLNSTRHFFKKISTQLNTFQVEYSTWCDQSKCAVILNSVTIRRMLSYSLIETLIS